MRAFAVHGDELQLGLADVTPELEPAVEELAFSRAGAVFVRRFPGDAPYAAAAAERFELCAGEIVAQAARLEPVGWEPTLEMLLERGRDVDWWLAGSAALAVRGRDVAPRDLDVIADPESCEHLAAALADLLVEPLVDGGWLGERWFRAFGQARIECVGGVHPSLDEPEPCDFGLYAAARLEPVTWRGHELRVPPLELQLASRRRRGLA